MKGILLTDDKRISFYGAMEKVAGKIAEIALPDSFEALYGHQSYSIAGHRLFLARYIMNDPTIDEWHKCMKLCQKMPESMFDTLVKETAFDYADIITEEDCFISPPAKVGDYLDRILPFCRQYLHSFFPGEMGETCFCCGEKVSAEEQVEACDRAELCKGLLEEAHLVK